MQTSSTPTTVSSAAAPSFSLELLHTDPERVEQLMLTNVKFAHEVFNTTQSHNINYIKSLPLHEREEAMNTANQAHAEVFNAWVEGVNQNNKTSYGMDMTDETTPTTVKEEDTYCKCGRNHWEIKADDVLPAQVVELQKLNTAHLNDMKTLEAKLVDCVQFDHVLPSSTSSA
jgi:hypothetical protein